MAKNEKKVGHLQVRLPEADFPRTMYFNRFRVERQEGFSLVHFALVSESGILVDEHCTVLTDDVLESNKKSLLDYLARIGLPKSTVLPWQGSMQPKKSDIADIINMTFQENVAETQFVLYSRMVAYRAGQEKQDQGKEIEVLLNGQAILLLRSSTDTQRHLIKALYE